MKPDELDLDELERLLAAWRATVTNDNVILPTAEYCESAAALVRSAPSLIAAARERDRLRKGLAEVRGYMSQKMRGDSEDRKMLAALDTLLDAGGTE